MGALEAARGDKGKRCTTRVCDKNYKMKGDRLKNTSPLFKNEEEYRSWKQKKIKP